ncbi:deoxyribodipyrimidine photo-lyase [Aliidiomarina sanyensis]|uniref:Deoxyribodipyrimidine photo-lyase n=1 Tax=Aliidiomarina sanyensis TaxID=1249555 RepID=A0A432WS54_9GAMM|nr:deoxyribodipyrimidine photo-lyase [Aliidiomarina sanyensis]RUO36597.1 deoxyribodipyrimidine photo-lyase [Aliidiomarina sanyensis]
MTALVWFRNDLRLLDNDAVYGATREHEQVEFVWVSTPEMWKLHDWSPAKWELYHRHAQTIADDLAERGYVLHVIEGKRYKDAAQKVVEYAKEISAAALYFNREYALHEVQRDTRVKQLAEKHGLAVHCFDSNLLVPPERIQTGGGSYYKMFTPFFKAWKAELIRAGIPGPYQRSVLPIRKKTSGPRISCHVPDELEGVCRSSQGWVVGEANIRKKVSAYILEKVSDYASTRDLPAQPGTSQLSPYWEIGAISPRVAAHFLQKQSPEFPSGLNEGMNTWLSELAWREFYQHLMFHEPRLCKHEPFQVETDNYPWSHDNDLFQAWCEGRTGFPIVDAGMQELRETGWMHNRVRMIVANFLTKDLHIDWRLGETFFMRNLIDGSFPANNGGWQWSASTGTDAVPYFRVFNPTRQSEKVDPKGTYIRKWVPALAAVPDKYIHEPHEWLTQHGKSDYPAPIVDHKEARETFISTFKRVKNG